MSSYDVIVVGGGISGLMSALALGKHRKKVLVLEQRSFLGGNCNSYIVDGFQVDTGPHAITGLTQGPLRRIINDYFDYTPIFLNYGTYFVRTPKGLTKIPSNITEFVGFDVLPRRDRLAISQAITKALTLTTFGMDTASQSVYDFLPKNLSSHTCEFVDAVCHFLSGRSMRETSVHRVLAGSSFVVETWESDEAPSTLTDQFTTRISRLSRLATNRVSQSQAYVRGGLKSFLKAVLYSMPSTVEIQTNQKVKKIITVDGRATGVETDEEYFDCEVVVYSGFAKQLPELVSELPEQYVSKLSRIVQTKSLTLWLGLTQELPEFDYIGSEIWFQDYAYWAMPISNYTDGLAPKDKQLIGFTFVLDENKNLETEKRRAMDTIVKAVPRIEKFIEMEHYQVTIPEKGAVTINGYIAENRTPIENLYLVGTDADRRSMGITRAGYSVLNMLKLLKKNEYLN
jgi:phytoene dehydrogenase-like protein